MRNTLLISSLMVLLGTPAVAATDGAMGSTPQIVVRCYPQTDLSPRDLELMRDVVIGAFEDTIDVAWQVCGSRNERAWTGICDQPHGVRWQTRSADEPRSIDGSGMQTEFARCGRARVSGASPRREMLDCSPASPEGRRYTKVTRPTCDRIVGQIRSGFLNALIFTRNP